MFYVSRWKWSWWLHLYSLFIIFARLKTWPMDCRIKLNKLTNWIKVWKIEMTLTVQEQSRERGKKKEMMDGEFVRNDRSREKHDWKWMHHRQHPHPYCMKFLSKTFYWQNYGWKGMFTSFTVHEYWAYEALLQNSHIECHFNKFMISILRFSQKICPVCGTNSKSVRPGFNIVGVARREFERT